MSVIRTKNRIQFAEDFVLNNKQIGIGTDNPQATLDLVGDAHVSGLITASQLSAPLYGGEVRFLSDVAFDGNVTIAGTSATIDAPLLRVEDKDIIIGYTTNTNGDEVSSDMTAKGGGIALASTEGNFLVNTCVVGIETIPPTYKKIVWYPESSFTGFNTDAWIYNYAVSIGNTTNVPVGTRLAVGDVLIDQTGITSIKDINATGIVTGLTADFDSYSDLNVTGVSTFNPDGLLVGTISSTSQKFGGILEYPELEAGTGGGTLSNNNLTLNGAGSSGHEAALSTFAATSGKYYVEITVTEYNTSSSYSYGIAGVSSTFNYNQALGDGFSYGITGSGPILYNGVSEGGGTSGSPNFNDVYGIQLNLDDNELTIYRNGATNGTISIIDDPLGYKFGLSGSFPVDDLTINFGETAFVYTPPAGYQGLFETSPYVEVEQSGLDFVGVSTFADNVTISGDLTVIGNISGELDLADDLVVGGNFSVAGVSTFNDTVDFKPDGLLVGTISSTSQKFGGIKTYSELVNVSGFGSPVLSNNNLTLTKTGGNGWAIVNSTQTVTSGKYYVEVSLDEIPSSGDFALSNVSFGIRTVNSTSAQTALVGNLDGEFGLRFDINDGSSAVILNEGTTIDNDYHTGSALNVGDIVGILLNLDDDEVYFSVAGTTGVAIPITSGVGYEFSVGVFRNDATITVNFGETPFTYTPPAGYQGLFETTPYVEVDNSGLDFVGVSTFTDTAIFDSTGSIQIPVGTTAERPGIAVTGQIRYNTENSSFEGYGPGGAWGSLGGVKDVDGDTYIIAETSAGSDEDTLYFYTGGELTGTISTTNGITGDGENIRSVYAPKAAAASYASYSETSNSALSIAGIATYNQVSKISASGNTGFMRVGLAIDGSHDGKTIVVGAYDKLIGGNDAGAVYVYDREGNSFNEVGILTGPTVSNAQYGWDVSTTADAKTIVIGARSDQLPGGNNAGKVYVYDRVGNDFNLVGILTGSLAGTSGDYFGSAVSISGNGKTLVVGAEQDEEVGSPNNSGVVYVYDRVGNDFNQVGILTGSFQQSGDTIGKQVDISYDGNVIVAGGDLADYQSVSNVGVAFVFERTGNTFNELTFLTGNGINDRFAHRISVSDDGNTIAISAERGDADGGSTLDVGKVHVYGRDGNNYNEILSLNGSQTPFGITNSAKFAFPRLSADGNTLVVGDNVLNIAYVYERQGNTFNEVTYFTGSDTDSGTDQFGNDTFITADGKTIYIGSPVQEDVVYAFDREKETYVYSDAEGNIGIGSAIPTEKLDVAGNIAVSGTVLAANLTNVAVADTFIASAGVAYTMDSYTLATDNIKTAEYTIHIENGSNIQSQKLLVMQNGTTAFSQEYAIMFDPDSVVSIASTLNAGVVSIEITPETGVLGLTTYRYIRQSII